MQPVVDIAIKLSKATDCSLTVHLSADRRQFMQRGRTVASDRSGQIARPATPDTTLSCAYDLGGMEWLLEGRTIKQAVERWDDWQTGYRRVDDGQLAPTTTFRSCIVPI